VHGSDPRGGFDDIIARERGLRRKVAAALERRRRARCRAERRGAEAGLIMMASLSSFGSMFAG